MKTKYDWWGAAVYVMKYNFIGFVASTILLLTVIVLGIILGISIVKVFGVFGGMLFGIVISLSTIAGLTYREIKKQGELYAKY